MIATNFAEFDLSIAHRLENVPPEHPCSRLHGHNYRVRIEITGEVGPLGWITDYDVIRREWMKLVHAELDHRNLNDVIGPNSTSENLCAWIWERLSPLFPGLSAIEAREVSWAGTRYEGDQ